VRLPGPLLLRAVLLPALLLPSEHRRLAAEAVRSAVLLLELLRAELLRAVVLLRSQVRLRAELRRRPELRLRPLSDCQVPTMSELRNLSFAL
jgi:hypothetical protein